MSDEEREELHEQMLVDIGASGECAIIDGRRSMHPNVIRFCGREIGRTDDWKEAMQLIADEAAKWQFWPNIYYINDHGNVTLLDSEGKEVCGWV